MRKIQTQRIRNNHYDFIKQLKSSTKEFLDNRLFSERLEEAHYDFIRACYLDDAKELEKIIFLNSSPFYEFRKAYDSIDHFSKILGKYRDAYVWEEYNKALESGLRKITYKNNKFYFEGEYVPIIPYAEKLININAFELISEFRKFGQGYDYDNTSLSKMLFDFKQSDFVKNHKLQEVYYYCETDESISGK